MRDTIQKLDTFLHMFLEESVKQLELISLSHTLGELLEVKGSSPELRKDFYYFILTKSTKTLSSIQHLLAEGLTEDALILIRSMFESYLCCRYLQQHKEKADEFVRNPLGLTLAHYNLSYNRQKQKAFVISRENKIVGVLDNPSSFRTGEDRHYYYPLYDFLCTFTHCNFGIVRCYTDQQHRFTTNKVNYNELSRILTLFIFTRLFEIVVGNEESLLSNEQKTYYENMINQSITIQSESIFILLDKYMKNESAFLHYHHKKMKTMLKEIHDALNEQLATFTKKQLVNKEKDQSL